MKKIICAFLSVLLLSSLLCSCSLFSRADTITGTACLPEGYSGAAVTLTLVATNLSSQGEDERTYEIDHFQLRPGARGKSFSFRSEDIPFDEYILSYQLSGGNSLLLQNGYIDDEGKTAPTQCTAHIFGDAITNISVCPPALTRCVGEISLPAGSSSVNAAVYAMVAGTEIDYCPVSVTDGQPALYEMYLPLEAAEVYDISYVIEGDNSSLMPYGTLCAVSPDAGQNPAVIDPLCLPGKYTTATQVTVDENFFGDNEYIIVEVSVMSDGYAMFAASSTVYPGEPQWTASLSLPSDRDCTMSLSVYAPDNNSDGVLLRTFYVTSAGLSSIQDDSLQISSENDVPKSINLIN